jgi:hypothetical protein
MADTQRTVDSLKLLQDWSKWLITLQTAICMSLWPKLTNREPVTHSPSPLMYAGWMMFWASILAAAVLLLCISIVVRRVDESGDRDIKKVWVLVGVQYAFFLLGLFCFALNILFFWLGLT